MSAFEERTNTLTMVKFPIVEGIGPERLFEVRDNLLSFVKFRIVEGIGPESLFL